MSTRFREGKDEGRAEGRAEGIAIGEGRGRLEATLASARAFIGKGFPKDVAGRPSASPTSS